MFIILDHTTDPELIHHFRVEASKLGVLSSSEQSSSYLPGQGVVCLFEMGRRLHREEGLIRWEQLELASRGARLFSDTPEIDKEESPLYAGPAPRSEEEIKRIISDLRYSEGRAEYYASYGVNYIGRTYSDARTVIVLDNKAKNKLHSPENSSEYFSLYNSLPKDWWVSCGFVSTGNVDKLGHFLENLPDVIPMAYTDGAKAKLNYLGIDFASIPTPPERPDPAYGTEVREKANRLDYDLSQK